MPRKGSGHVADGMPGTVQVVTAAPALALRVLPAESDFPKAFTAEQNRGHPDMPRVIPVLQAVVHLAGRIGPERREFRPTGQSRRQAGHAAGSEYHVVIQQHDERGRPQPLPLIPRAGNRLEATAVARPSGARDPDDAQCNPVLRLDRLPDVPRGGDRSRLRNSKSMLTAKPLAPSLACVR